MTAMSSAESEYYAATTAAKEIVFLRQLVTFLHKPVQGPTALRSDNQGALRWRTVRKR